MYAEQDENSEIDEIRLDNIKSATLVKVIEYCTHYPGEPMTEVEKPLKFNTMEEAVQGWYATFVDLEPKPLKELITAAHFLDIKPLYNLACAKVAFTIKAKIPEEIANLPYK